MTASLATDTAKNGGSPVMSSGGAMSATSTIGGAYGFVIIGRRVNSSASCCARRQRPGVCQRRDTFLGRSVELRSGRSSTEWKESHDPIFGGYLSPRQVRPGRLRG